MADVYSTDTSYLSQGLLSSDRGQGIVRQGLPTRLGPLPNNPNDTILVVVPPEIAQPGMGRVLILPSWSPILDANGALVAPYAASLSLGQGKRLQFTGEEDVQGIISPAAIAGGDPVGSLKHVLDSGLASYTGSDIRVLIEVAETPAGTPRCAKQLLELTTLTVSVHRVKSPVTAAGFINTKGFSRGRRTIAGTLVMTKFTTEVLLRFLDADVIRDRSKDTYYSKMDQLPPFNLTILFADEWGHASYQRLLRVEFVTDGSVYSIQDMLTEQTISYMAADFTPLLPLTRSALYAPASADRTISHERVPTDLWAGPTPLPTTGGLA